MERDFFRESVIMANELDVAGEFIYSAINKLNQGNKFNRWRRHAEAAFFQFFL